MPRRKTPPSPDAVRSKIRTAHGCRWPLRPCLGVIASCFLSQHGKKWKNNSAKERSDSENRRKIGKRVRPPPPLPFGTPAPAVRKQTAPAPFLIAVSKKLFFLSVNKRRVVVFSLAKPESGNMCVCVCVRGNRDAESAFSIWFFFGNLATVSGARASFRKIDPMVRFHCFRLTRLRTCVRSLLFQGVKRLTFSLFQGAEIMKTLNCYFYCKINRFFFLWNFISICII